jgi:hypothetical protein
MRDDCALDGGGRQSERGRRGAECQGKPERTMPKPHRHDDGRGEKNGHRPGCRLPIGAEIDDDAAAEENCKPGHQPAHADLGRKPFAKPASRAPHRDCNKTGPDPGGSCRDGRRPPGLSSAGRTSPARSFRLRHRVAPAPPQRFMLYEAGQPVSHLTAQSRPVSGFRILNLKSYGGASPSPHPPREERGVHDPCRLARKDARARCFTPSPALAIELGSTRVRSLLGGRSRINPTSAEPSCAIPPFWPQPWPRCRAGRRCG